MENQGAILVVDDSAPNRLLLRSILQGAGYRVSEAQNGRECLEQFQKTAPDMILLDIMMPELDGLTVCRMLRETHSKLELPIIMVTTLSEADDVAQGLKLGANDYLFKPIERQVLLARIENHLALVHAQRQVIEQKKAVERALKIQNCIGDALPEAVLVHDQQGSIVYFNAEVERLCGAGNVQSAEHVFETAYDGLFAANWTAAYRELLPHVHRNSEYQFESRLGNRTIRIHSRPVALGNGEYQRVWVWRDETELKELERRASQRIKLDTVGLFAAGIAHNFNNIMGGVLGAAELLGRMNKDNERALRCVSVIKRGVESGMRLTRKMGTIHRRQGSTDRSASDLRSLLDSILAGYRQLLSNRIELEVSLPPILPPIAISDPQLLEVIGSVVTNAIEAIEAEGRVVITGTMDPSGTALDLTVVDTGSGMPEGVKSRLYEPFFSTKRVDQMSGVSVEGRGLGLWNTYNLLRMHHGDLHIESEAGKGTTVWIKLPCCGPRTDSVAPLP
jgi:two-component system NtrC family sensor kinase